MSERKKMLLLTHIDLDGYGCRILAEFYAKTNGLDLEVKHIDNHEVDTESMELLFSRKLADYDYVFMTDISFSEEVAAMIDSALYSGSINHFRLFDHHKTALPLNKYEWAQVQIEHEPGKRASGTSLFLQHLKELDDRETSRVEVFAEMVRRYDTWEWHDVYNDIQPKRLNDLFIIYGGKRFVEHISIYLAGVSAGIFGKREELVLDLEKERIDRYYRQKKKGVVIRQVDGYNLCIVHADKYHSELGMRLGQDFPEADIIVIMNIGDSKMSFRTAKPDVDVSEFAKQYGGGGHAQSSGASVNRIVIEKFLRDVFDAKN